MRMQDSKAAALASVRTGKTIPMLRGWTARPHNSEGREETEQLAVTSHL